MEGTVFQIQLTEFTFCFVSLQLIDLTYSSVWI